MRILLVVCHPRTDGAIRICLEVGILGHCEAGDGRLTFRADRPDGNDAPQGHVANEEGQAMTIDPNKDRPAGDPLGVRDLFGNLRANWAWLLALGIVFAILGIAGLFLTVAVTIATVTVLGIFLIIGGVLQIVQSFQTAGWHGRWPHLLIALVYIAAGVLIVIDPILASLTLTIILAAFILAVGLLRLAMAWQHRGERGNGLLWLSGLLAVLLAVIIAAGWPVSGLTVIGILVSIELLFHGMAYIGLALALKPAG